MEKELHWLLQSSQDPTAVANKVKGLILMASSAIIFVAGFAFHVHLAASDVLTLATEISGIVGALLTVYGGILHLVTWFGTIEKQG